MQQKIREFRVTLLNITMKELLDEKEMLYDELVELQRTINDLLTCMTNKKKREPSGLSKEDLGYQIRRMKNAKG